MAWFEVNRMSKVFGAGKKSGFGVRAINDLTFSMDRGEIVAVIGPNGAGKTTLFRLIMGLEKPNSGEIIFDGEALSRLPTYKRVSKGLTCTFQIVRIFGELTVLENVMIGRHSKSNKEWISVVLRTRSSLEEEKLIQTTSYELLKLVGLQEKATYIAGDLAIAEQRFIELARALGSEPKMLLLDEPASGLDYGEMDQTKEIISSIRNRGTTILLVEHNMDFVMDLSDRIIVLNYGEKLAEGSPEEIKRNKDVLKAYLGGILDDEN
jgi:ABC-type branched-subunit amino acid transport system ATPase component